MKKIIFFLCFMILTSLAYSQVSTDMLLKSTWAKVLLKNKPKSGGNVNTFDVDGKYTEWPILYQPESDQNVEEIDNMNFHMALPEKPVNGLSTLMNYAPSSVAKYKSTSFEVYDFMAKPFFKEAITKRFGSTKNIYCLSSEKENSDEFVIVIFSVKNGIAKMVGFWINYYTG
jgi:hypothetical protein